ncbi:hypothetical protein CPLU01_13680 [Colletotrichum plurivorum]|uniref:Uncharacterized protein n=1 Tax=Colletotrichum plurivorum TaxID=2175906 RepID=A0A8H6N2I4_9PEZI|nr:hypothetical protein CPLU01_13680 [Colletotrichum plurivorum]
MSGGSGQRSIGPTDMDGSDEGKGVELAEHNVNATSDCPRRSVMRDEKASPVSRAQGWQMQQISRIFPKRAICDKRSREAEPDDKAMLRSRQPGQGMATRDVARQALFAGVEQWTVPHKRRFGEAISGNGRWLLAGAKRWEDRRREMKSI